MAIPARPNTTAIAVTAAATQVSTTSFKVPSGVALVGNGAFAIGNSNGVTFNTAASTDGFPVQANTTVTVPPSFFNGDLSNLYLIAGGAVTVWLIYV